MTPAMSACSTTTATAQCAPEMPAAGTGTAALPAEAESVCNVEGAQIHSSA
jgi:hypothetical protein